MNLVKLSFQTLFKGLYFTEKVSSESVKYISKTTTNTYTEKGFHKANLRLSTNNPVLHYYKIIVPSKTFLVVYNHFSVKSTGYTPGDCCNCTIPIMYGMFSNSCWQSYATTCMPVYTWYDNIIMLTIWLPSVSNVACNSSTTSQSQHSQYPAV